MTTRIQKLITFSPKLYELLEKKAEAMGITFPEYIRGLAVNDIKKSFEYMPLVDEATEKQIAKSLSDKKKEEYAVLASDEDIAKHFEK